MKGETQVAGASDLVTALKTGKFQHVYLLYGDEDYLKKQYRDRLVKALLGSGSEMNHNSYSGDNAEEGAIIDQAETLPFFSDHRVIQVDDSGLFKGSSELLSDYLKKVPDYLYLVFTEKDVDKRSRLYKAVQKNGSCIEIGSLGERDLLTWVLRNLTKHGLKIRKSEMDYFLSRTGTDMNHILLELDKVVNYCEGKGTDIVTKEAIDAVTESLTENRIFDMISAVASHDRKKAFDLYADLLALREPPMRILYLIGRQYNQLLMIRELSSEGEGVSQIASKTKIPPFAVRRNLGIAGKYSISGLKRSVSACVEAEEQVKTGRMEDRLAVELILIRFSST
jgi:DNA polymerase-3 subunit delta